MQQSDPIYGGLVLPEEGACFHCGEPLPKKPFFSHVLGEERTMCCLGCKLAADSIVEAGLEQYYLDRQKISRVASLPDALNFEVYNHADIKSQFTYQEAGSMVAELSVVGLRCAACSWLIETRLARVSGVRLCQVNLTESRMRVLWDDTRVCIGDILRVIHEIGYDAKPYRQDTHEADMQKHNKKLLVRLGVAAIGAMQAMMFSIGLYFGEYTTMAVEHRDFLRMVSMVVSVPVVFYAGMPFFGSAYIALKARQINMDVPVSIALILTFCASAYALAIRSGETYFDSVSMFVFFLLVGRYLEAKARLKAANRASDLLVITPKLVQKLGEAPTLLADFLNDTIDAQKIAKVMIELPSDGVSVPTVSAGDVVLVAAGDELIGDGVLLSKNANVFESLITGESDLIQKTCGDTLFGGSQNDAQPLIMLITDTAQNSKLALIDRLMHRAMTEKPKIALEADRMAKWFITRVLVLSAVVFGVWWWIDPHQAIWATVAVLVATCPCALSLATPIALTVATNRLARGQFLATRGHTVPTLGTLTHIAFDKTGTLTTGTPTLLYVQAAQGFHTDTCLAIAAALETASRHPVARTLSLQAKKLYLPATNGLTHHAGGGVEATIRGVRWRIGHGDFAFNQKTALPNLGTHGANMAVALTYQGDDGAFCPAAWFYFNDTLRADVGQTIAQIKSLGIVPIMLTGDPSQNAALLGADLGIQTHTGLLPEQKVSHIKALQNKGAVVLMVGDGINDAPVLAAADVSVAMATGADLAQVASDGVLLCETLTPIYEAVITAQKTKRIIRQNLRWAFFYNSVVLLPAALGYVPPWLAAIGMSLSSLFVVLNALRIS